MILTTNYMFPCFGKPKEHGNLDSKQDSFDCLFCGRAVFLLLIAAVAEYHKQSSLKQHIYRIHCFIALRGQKSETDFTGLNSR